MLAELDVRTHEYVLTRLDVVAPITAERLRVQARGQRTSRGSRCWARRGRTRARCARYLVLMAIAGVIAGLGVIESNSVLIVGAMAVSPDLLPVCALSVGLVARRWRLVRTVGRDADRRPGAGRGVAAVLTALLELDRLPRGRVQRRAELDQQARRPHRLLDGAGRAGCRRRGDALVRDPRQRRGRGRDLGDDDSRLGLPGRRLRIRRRCPRGSGPCWCWPSTSPC